MRASLQWALADAIGDLRVAADVDRKGTAADRTCHGPSRHLLAVQVDQQVLAVVDRRDAVPVFRELQFAELGPQA